VATARLQAGDRVALGEAGIELEVRLAEHGAARAPSAPSPARPVPAAGRPWDACPGCGISLYLEDRERGRCAFCDAALPAAPPAPVAEPAAASAPVAIAVPSPAPAVAPAPAAPLPPGQREVTTAQLPHYHTVYRGPGTSPHRSAEWFLGSRDLTSPPCRADSRSPDPVYALLSSVRRGRNPGKSADHHAVGPASHSARG
jgi:hypothetical protein